MLSPQAIAAERIREKLRFPRRVENKRGFEFSFKTAFAFGLIRPFMKMNFAF